MPSELVVAVQTVPRSLSTAVTLASGTAAPDGSVIFPVNAAITCWPLLGWGIQIAIKSSRVAATENPMAVADFMETPVLFILIRCFRLIRCFGEDPTLMLGRFFLYVQFTTVAEPLREGLLQHRTSWK